MKSGAALELEQMGEVVRRAFDFSGRSRRTGGVLYYFAIQLLALCIVMPIEAAFPSSPARDFISVIGLILMVPLVAWLVRRAHDFGMSGWWLLGLLVAPLLAAFVPLDDAAGGVLILVQIAASMGAVFWKPDPEANRFGPNPRFGETSEKSAT